MTRHSYRVGLLVAALAVAQPAHAGFATRLMFPFEISDARSLPWGADGIRGLTTYDIRNVLRDTDALLTPSTPVIVRLETLRRAVIYASADPAIAKGLLTTFTERARVGTPSTRPGALALLDAAFVTDLFWQLGQHYNPPFTEVSRQVRGLVDGAGGWALIQRCFAAMPNDPQFMFGVALIAGVTHLGEAPFTEHTLAARAGADRDVLLARNLPRIYADRTLELAEQADKLRSDR